MDVEFSPTKKRAVYTRLSSDEEIRAAVKYIDDELIDDDTERGLNRKIYREVILITISLFMGYASLVCLQKKLYNQWELNIGGTLSNKQKQLFEHGTSLIYCLV